MKRLKIVLISVLLAICIAATMLLLYVKVYIPHKYRKELEFISEFVFDLSEGKTAEVKSMSTNDFALRETPKYLKEMEVRLKTVDLKSMKLIGIDHGIENNETLYYVTVNFDDEAYKDVYFVLVRSDNGYLVKLCHTTDVF